MSFTNLREWIAKTEEMEQLKRITTGVDWNLELGGIARLTANRQGPALLFENIKDYKNTACRRLFIDSLGSRERVAVAIGLPREASY